MNRTAHNAFLWVGLYALPLCLSISLSGCASPIIPSQLLTRLSLSDPNLRPNNFAKTRPENRIETEATLNRAAGRVRFGDVWAVATMYGGQRFRAVGIVDRTGFDAEANPALEITVSSSSATVTCVCWFPKSRPLPQCRDTETKQHRVLQAGDKIQVTGVFDHATYADGSLVTTVTLRDATFEKTL